MEPCCVDTRTGLPAHNRLDLIRQTAEYTAPECGSLRRDTGQPDYCCYDCPLLIELHIKGQRARKSDAASPFPAQPEIRADSPL